MARRSACSPASTLPRSSGAACTPNSVLRGQRRTLWTSSAGYACAEAALAGPRWGCAASQELKKWVDVLGTVCWVQGFTGNVGELESYGPEAKREHLLKFWEQQMGGRPMVCYNAPHE